MREGLIPTVLGTAVTATGIALGKPDIRRRGSMKKRDVKALVSAGVLGFGLAHVVLGSIDLARK